MLTNSQKNVNLAPANLNVYRALTDDVWMSKQVALHLEGTDLISTAFDDVNAAAAQNPINAILIDRCVTCIII